MAQAGARIFAFSEYTTQEKKIIALSAFTMWFQHGIIPRNRSLYIEIDESLNIGTPSQIDWKVGVEMIYELFSILWAATKDVGHSPEEIFQKLSEESKANIDRMVAGLVAHCMMAGMTKEDALEAARKATTI